MTTTDRERSINEIDEIVQACEEEIFRLRKKLNLATHSAKKLKLSQAIADEQAQIDFQLYRRNRL